MIDFDQKTLKNLIFYTGPRILATCANFIIIPVVLASFDIVDYGIYALYLSISLFATVFTFPRISFESKIGIARGEEEAFTACLIDRLMVSIPILVAPLLFFFFGDALSFDFDISLFLIVMYGTILPTILFQAISSYFLAREQFFSSSALELFRAVVTGGISAGVAYFTNNLWLFAAVKGALDLTSLGILIVFVSIRRNLIRVFRVRGYHRSIRNYGIKMILSDGAATMRTQSTVWLVAAFLGPESVTLFHVAFSSMFQRVRSHVLSLINLVYAKVARGLPGGQRTDSWKSVLTMLVTGLVMALLTIGLAFAYVSLLLPDAFSQVFSLYIALAFSLPFSIATKIVLLKLIIDLDTLAITGLTLSMTLLQLLLSIVFISVAGLLGGCLAIVASSIVELAISLLVVRWRRAKSDHLARSTSP